jgi:uncharacterized membrane protein
MPDDAPQPFHLTLMGRLRAYLVAGVLVTAPIGITAWVVWVVVTWVDSRVGALLPRSYNPNTYLPFAVPGFGIVVSAVFLVLVGWLTANLFGRLLLRIGEAIVGRTPLVRTVYSTLKQIFETVLAERSTMFRKVVLVEFPRAGLWRVGFVTGVTPGRTQAVHPAGLVNVFIPGTPNVASGFLVLVPAGEAIELELGVEEALRLVVSGGIATPRPTGARQPDRASATAASRSNR